MTQGDGNETNHICARPLVKLIYIIFACGALLLWVALFFFLFFFAQTTCFFFCAIIQQIVERNKTITVRAIAHQFVSHFLVLLNFVLLFVDIEKWATELPQFYLLPFIYNLIHLCILQNNLISKWVELKPNKWKYNVDSIVEASLISIKNGLAWCLCHIPFFSFFWCWLFEGTGLWQLKRQKNCLSYQSPKISRWNVKLKTN